MQQVFDFVNGIFMQNKESRKRNLFIRTYKIVPTTPQTGVLQWVDNTVPFGIYLCDNVSGAHDRYFPNDWSHAACREYLRNANTHDTLEKLTRIKEVFKNFHPVFRYFLLESYADPSVWLARRLTYTKSVAASSIVTYILGIGDRLFYSHL